MARPQASPRQLAYYNTALGVADVYSVAAAVLIANATLTSDWVRSRLDPLDEDATDLPIDHAGPVRVVGMVTADQISAASPNGIIIDFSNDHADTKTGVVSIGLGGIAVANDVANFDILVRGLFVRLRYVNGATVQGSMQLAAWLQGPSA